MSSCPFRRTKKCVKCKKFVDEIRYSLCHKCIDSKKISSILAGVICGGPCIYCSKDTDSFGKYGHKRELKLICWKRNNYIISCSKCYDHAIVSLIKEYANDVPSDLIYMIGSYLKPY